MAHQDVQNSSEGKAGVFYGLAAYTIWGLSVVYWKELFEAGAVEILSHRVVWGSLMILGILLVRKRIPYVLAMVRDLKLLGLLVMTAALLGINWSFFVWAVISDQVLQASLGYYINPLVNVLIGTFLLKENMSRFQLVAVLLAGFGVLAMVVIGGTFPWLALTLAITFAVYGYLRKISNVIALDALFIEMSLFVPAALIVIFWVSGREETVFGSSNPGLSLLLIGGGLITLAPLSFFGEAVRRVRLITIGFMQYLAPTIQFLLAVFVYGEDFSAGHIAAFGCIWAGLIIYSVDAIRNQ